MKAGDTFQAVEENGELKLVDSEGRKYLAPAPFSAMDETAYELTCIISDIAKEGDEYAKTVIPLIQRILADDYTGSGLFEAIDAELKKVEAT